MSVYAPTTDYIWELVQSRSIDPHPIFLEAGIDPKVRFDTKKRVTRESFLRLIDLAAQACDDPAFGLRATVRYHPSHFGALGYSWLTSSSLSTALQKFLRYSQVVSDTHFLKVKENTPNIVVDFTRPKKVQSSLWHLHLSMGLFMHLCRLILGQEFAPEKVSFIEDMPEDIEPFEEHFKCPLEFGAKFNAVIIPMGLMDKRATLAHPELSTIHDEVITRYLAFRDKNDIISQAKLAIAELLEIGDISAESIAKQLHISARTFSRRLDAEGTTFRELLSDYRHELAISYIRDNALTLTEISYLLGFSEQSSFSRAYRGWTGMSPTEARVHGLSL